jgi:hypothetical protein
MTRTSDTDRNMLQLIARLVVMAGDIPAVNPNQSGGRSCEHPGGKQPAGGGLSGHDWWQMYLARPAHTIELAIRTLEEALHGPKDKPAGETPAQEMDRKTARVMHLHADGSWTTVDIARDTGLTIGQVAKIIMGATITATLTAKERAHADEVLRLWEEDNGRTVRFLAARTGIPKSTVQRILRRAA